MSTWYEQATFYHMYPLGMTGAPMENPQGPADRRFGELEAYIPHMEKLWTGGWGTMMISSVL